MENIEINNQESIFFFDIKDDNKKQKLILFEKKLQQIIFSKKFKNSYFF